MKNLMFILMAIGFVLNLSAQNSIVALINKPDEMQIRATVRTDKTMYVGLTINPDTKNEINFRGEKVHSGISYVDFDVSKIHRNSNSLKRVFTDPENYAKNEIVNEELPYVVALWENKVNIINCTLDNGKPCRYCKKRGYHLEGRIDRETAGYSPNGQYEVIDKQ
jgi:hypothetical protein